ncbi:MAG: hypothetical protein WAO20_09550 [Acidobacteriota bacterium]
MPHCAFLTMDTLEDFVCDDELAVGPLARLGWNVEFVSWRQRDTDWDRFDLVVIRSTWDYQKDPALFLSVLESIERSRARLENPLSLVRWNLRKTYLKELQGRGVEIVPTRWCRGVDPDRLASLYDEFGVDELVLKPVIGANADHAFRIRRDGVEDSVARLEASYAGGQYLAQPFMDNVVSEGEYSLFYFGGELSHVILKTPRESDFRVQEEHGGLIQRAGPSKALVDAGGRAMSALSVMPLYGRVDLVRAPRDVFQVMELELIEPALYFRMDPQSPDRFARTLDRWLG